MGARLRGRPQLRRRPVSADNSRVQSPPTPPPVFEPTRQPAHREPKSDSDRLALLLALAAPLVMPFISVAVGWPAVVVFLAMTGASWYLVGESRAWTAGERSGFQRTLLIIPALVIAMLLVFTLTPEDTLGNGLGPGVIFYMLILVALVNLLVQVVRMWSVRSG